ncbi:MAG: hypothetical protein AAF502_04770 [Bacteroidota bacterium]
MFFFYKLKDLYSSTLATVVTVLLVICTYTSTNATPVNETDSLALVAIYNSMGGTSWNASYNWLTSTPVTSWFGVGVTNDRVTTLALNGNNLTGAIPSELGDLDALEIIQMVGNQITGAIPESIGNLVDLRELIMFANSLDQPLPDAFGAMTQLQIVQMSSNAISGPLPPTLAGVSSLMILNLSDNQLSGALPSTFENASSLLNLDLSFNNLIDAIPAEIGRMTSLQTLLLNNNELSGPIPADFGDLSNLQALSLHTNNLSGNLPPQLGFLSDIFVLYLENNSFSGPLPPEYGNLGELIFFYANNNNLTGPIPETLGNLTKLRTLSLSNNDLSGEIPDLLGAMNLLRELYLDGNQLTGEIPPELADLTQLQSLILESNQLSGPFPVELTNIDALKYISISGNDISDLPDLSVLPNLVSLQVQGNKLTFEDIYPNIGAPTGLFSYTPQQEVYTTYTDVISYGSSLSIEGAISGFANQYEWIKDNVTLTSSASSELNIPSVDYDDAGVYSARITSPLVPGLIISRRPVTVEVFSPLPIELLNFEANLENGKVLLEWVTVSEFQNDFFTIERSSDGVVFEELVRIEGAGDSNTENYYHTVDEAPFLGTSYYRLKQTDFDGEFTYSDVEVIYFRPEADLVAFPSPIALGETLSVRIFMEGTITVELFDSQSRLIYIKSIEHNPGDRELQISTSGLSPGVYLVTAKNREIVSQQRILIADP